MHQYAFQATNPQGQRFSGTLMATDSDTAMRCLVEKDLIVTRFYPIRGDSLAGRLRSLLGLGQRPELEGEALFSFSRQLAAMLEAGVPLKEGIDVMGHDASDPRARSLLLDMSTQVGSGTSVTEVLSAHPKVFSRQYIATISAGESSGRLPEALHTMADLGEKADRLQRQVTSALYYPGFICVVAVVFITLMLGWVVPRYAVFYTQLGDDLPAATALLTGTGVFVQDHLLLLALAALAALLGARHLLSTERGRLWFDDLLLRLPGLGLLFRQLAIARLCRSLAALLDGGLPLMHALLLVGETMGNRVLEQAVSRVAPQVLEGSTLVDALRSTGVLTDMALSMIAAGERSGKLDPMLERVAIYYEDRVEAGFKAWASMVEPLIILLVGLVVAAMIVVLVLPVFGLVHVLVS